ncbi:MAG: hypothetical protein KDN05_24600, partial [Verrucomicrobiae bacterium]|nr:hypothetical protein [Verrucomicrobiae bacterium]
MIRNPVNRMCFANARLICLSLLIRGALTIAMGSAALPVCAESAPARPNFLVILTDDQGYGDVSTYGAADVRTP